MQYKNSVHVRRKHLDTLGWYTSTKVCMLVCILVSINKTRDQIK
jgi:hypothetical protein